MNYHDVDFGLRGLILKAERPYADHNAMADIEGRVRPVVLGGIDRTSNPWWRSRVTTTTSDTD